MKWRSYKSSNFPFMWRINTYWLPTVNCFLLESTQKHLIAWLHPLDWNCFPLINVLYLWGIPQH
jgi:hypothetical protein